ncbi:hypothetical protein SERLA73DRAFT_187363, partial [Serpula lacrymans var. lacrymans S7.3]
MIILNNDMVSYIKERDDGHHAHNLVTNVMYEMNVDIHGAMCWIEQRNDHIIQQFLTTKKEILDLDKELDWYIWGIGNLVRGTISWFYESERYFGKRGLEIQQDRW